MTSLRLLQVAHPIRLGLARLVVRAMAPRVALTDNDVRLIAVPAAYLTTLGIGVAACVIRALALVQEKVVRLILTHDKILRRVIVWNAVYVVDNSGSWQTLPECTLNDQSVFQDIPQRVTLWMIGRLKLDVASGPRSARVREQSPPLRGVTANVPVRLPSDPPASLARHHCNVGRRTTTTPTQSECFHRRNITFCAMKIDSFLDALAGSRPSLVSAAAAVDSLSPQVCK